MGTLSRRDFLKRVATIGIAAFGGDAHSPPKRGGLGTEYRPILEHLTALKPEVVFLNVVGPEQQKLLLAYRALRPPYEITGAMRRGPSTSTSALAIRGSSMAKGCRGALSVLLLVVVGIVKGCLSSPKETFTSPSLERNRTA